MGWMDSHLQSGLHLRPHLPFGFLRLDMPHRVHCLGVKIALGDWRPGQQAARELKVLTPLLDAGLTKADIRELSRRVDLPVWDRPASACLSSRIAYGIEVTPERLAIVEKGEDALRAMGFRQFRVRYHEQLVRLEISHEEMPRALSTEMTRKFVEIFKELGFKFVTLDLEGYRTGSMNSLLVNIQK